MKGLDHDDGSEVVAAGTGGNEGDGAVGGVMELARFIPGIGWQRLPNGRKGRANASADTKPTIRPIPAEASKGRKAADCKTARYYGKVKQIQGVVGPGVNPVVFISRTDAVAMGRGGLSAQFEGNVLARQAKGEQ